MSEKSQITALFERIQNLNAENGNKDTKINNQRNEIRLLQSQLTTAQEENKRYKDALEKALEASAMFPTGNAVFDKQMMDDVYNTIQSALDGGK